MDRDQLRLTIKANGYVPLAACGKRVLLSEWQKKSDVTDDEVRSWSTARPDWTNSSVLTQKTPALDLDILIPDAVAACEAAVREWFDGRGVITTRFGNLPKRAILFQTSKPFGKILARYVAPDGSKHRIEFLGNGQQIVVDGINPDSKTPYSWHADLAPWTVKREDLPEINEDDARALVALLGEMLTETFGFQPENVMAGSGPSDTEAGHDGPLDVDACLASMQPNGASVNDVQSRVILSLLQKGEHPADICDRVVEHTMTVADAAELGWSRDVEIKEVNKRIKSDLAKLRGEYDFESGVIPRWLAGEFHKAWVDALAAGGRPWLLRNAHGWYVQRGLDWRNRTDAASSDAGEQPGRSTASSTTPGTRAAKRTLVLRPFIPFDPATLPPRAWLYAKHYQRRTVSLTAGPGGMGKSSLVLVECVAMATARNLLGEQPAERLRIWLHNGEDPLEEIHRRLAAICQHYKIPQEELSGQLWLTSGNEFPLRVAKGYANLEINAALVRQISDAIGDNGIDVAAFDPLVTLHSVSEGDPGKMDTVVRLFAGIADEHDASVELNHHVRKPAAGSDADHDVFDIRGVMAITDAVRAARVLNRMNKADAENAGLDEITRLSHFRVDKAKGNYSPAQAATWRRFVSIDLPNTDSVGVVEPWDFPGQGTATPEKAAADQRAEHVFLQLLDKFLARGVNVSVSVGPNYAPAKFAGEQAAVAGKVSKAALKAAMTRLLDAGRIRTEPTGRSDRGSHHLVPWQGDPK